MKKIMTSLPLFFSFFMAMQFCGTAIQAQDVSQVVKSNIVYCCTEYHDVTDSFPTPDGAVKHYIKQHMPEGYKLVDGSIEVFNNGNVNFVTNKNGAAEATQSGHVSGYVNCPPNSSPLVVSGDVAFKDKKCLCDNGYKSNGTACTLPAKPASPAKPKTAAKTKGG